MMGFATKRHLHSINGLTMREKLELEREQADRRFRWICWACIFGAGTFLYFVGR